MSKSPGREKGKGQRTFWRNLKIKFCSVLFTAKLEPKQKMGTIGACGGGGEG
jgi:hypothetical protein